MSFRQHTTMKMPTKALWSHNRLEWYPLFSTSTNLLPSQGFVPNLKKNKNGRDRTQFRELRSTMPQSQAPLRVIRTASEVIRYWYGCIQQTLYWCTLSSQIRVNCESPCGTLFFAATYLSTIFYEAWFKSMRVVWASFLSVAQTVLGCAEILCAVIVLWSAV